MKRRNGEAEVLQVPLLTGEILFFRVCIVSRWFISIGSIK